MKKVCFTLSFLTVLVALLPVLADASVITFEDLYTGAEEISTIPSGYAGFSWNAFAWYITRNYIGSENGYTNGMTGNVCAFNAFETDLSVSRTTPFDFLGANISAAWNIDEDVTVEGWLGSDLQYTQTIYTSYDDSYWFDFNFYNIDKVIFKSLPKNGTPGEGLVGSGAHIGIDNINYTDNIIPEPSAFILLIPGLFGLGLIKRRK